MQEWCTWELAAYVFRPELFYKLIYENFVSDLGSGG